MTVKGFEGEVNSLNSEKMIWTQVKEVTEKKSALDNKWRKKAVNAGK